MIMKNNKRLIFEILLRDGNVITVDDNLIRAEFGALDRGSLTDVVDFGIYANRGSFSFIDRDGFFNNQNVNSVDIKRATVKIYLAKKERHLIATFDIDECSFNDETKTVEISLISNLQKWQSIEKKSEWFPYYITDLTVIVSAVNQLFGKPISLEGFGKNISIFCPIIERNKSLWNIVTEICQATMGRVAENPDGSVVITDPYLSRKPIVVNPKNITKIPSDAFVRIPNSSMDVTNRVRIVDTAKLDFSINWNGYTDLTSENTVASFDGANLMISDDDTSAYVTGSVSTENPIYAVHLPQISQTDEIQSFVTTDGNLPYPFQKTKFTPYPLLSLVGIKLTSKSDNYQEVSFACEDFPIKISKVNELHLRTEETVVVKASFEAGYDTFSDSKEELEMIHYPTDEIVKIQSSTLVQTNSRYDNKKDGYVVKSVPLAEHILTEVRNRYANGIECFEIECLFNDYYYTDGTLAFDGADLSQHFNKYDIIEPYTVKHGQVVPLRKNEDGSAKQFRIIGISYTYDGFLRQKLYVQEERYDDKMYEE